MAGRFPPETENPVPEVESELIVTGTVPLEVTVIDIETDVPTDTLPNDSEVALSVRAGVAAFNCSPILFDEPLALAVNVAVCAVLTEATVTGNEAAEEPVATITLVGMVREIELVVRATL